MTYNVRLSSPSNYKVNLSSFIEVMPTSLNQLTDVEISGNNDQYVLMYDASSGKWRDVNPDAVLTSSSSTETTQPGLPSTFTDTLDVDLDNRIDLDGGSF